LLFRTYRRNLKFFIISAIEISPFGRNDKNGNCDTFGFAGITTRGEPRGSKLIEINLMIEKDFDIAFIANLALREKQIQQNDRPIGE
jgi:hypothetical protein